MMKTGADKARDEGDADAYAQYQIAHNGLEMARAFFTREACATFDALMAEAPMLPDEIRPRPGFYSDVGALLRLETQSDETESEAAERKSRTGETF